MRAYVGQCRGSKLIAACQREGWGECTQPDEYPPRRRPWFADNGAFKAWRAGRAFDGDAFAAYVARLAAEGAAPEFVVAPDVVAGGGASLALSVAWAPRLAPLGAPLALVVQDGMAAAEVAAALGPFCAAVRRRHAAVEDRDGARVGAAGARARAALPRRARRHAEARRVGAAHRRRLDRLVPAAVERREVPRVRGRAARGPGAGGSLHRNGVVTP